MSAGGVNERLNCERNARVDGGISTGGGFLWIGWSSHILNERTAFGFGDGFVDDVKGYSNLVIDAEFTPCACVADLPLKMGAKI